MLLFTDANISIPKGKGTASFIDPSEDKDSDNTLEIFLLKFVSGSIKKKKKKLPGPKSPTDPDKYENKISQFKCLPEESRQIGGNLRVFFFKLFFLQRFVYCV